MQMVKMPSKSTLPLEDRVYPCGPEVGLPIPAEQQVTY